MANEIRVASGDDLQVAVELRNTDDEVVAIGTDDALTLTVSDAMGGSSLLSSTVTGSQVFTIAGDDIAALGAGFYVFDVGLETSGGVRSTVVAPGAFLVLPRVEEVVE